MGLSRPNALEEAEWMITKPKYKRYQNYHNLLFFPHLRVSNFHKWPLEVDGHGQRLALELICQETKYPVPFFHRQFSSVSWGNKCFFSANARSSAACHCCWELCPDQTQRGFFPSKSEKYPRYHLPRRKRWPTWFPSTLIQPQWGLHMNTQYTLLLMFRVTLIVGLPPRLTSFWILNPLKFPQISSNFL